MSLAGVNILVTRPAGQGETLLQAIREHGGVAWHYPVMATNGLDSGQDAPAIQLCKQRFMNLDQYQHVIFISTNAVQYGLGWIDQYWPQLPVDIHWYGIGKATSRALQAEAIAVSTDPDTATGTAMNSEQLLQHPQLQQLQSQKVLIVRGVGGRDYLQQQLSLRGAHVDCVDCYRRLCADKPVGEVAQLIQQQQINTLCANSGESLQNLCQLAGEPALPELKKLTVVVPGQRVAAIAEKMGFNQIVVAENASDKAILAALLTSA